ncbi:RlmE family RNA methyltransferase [Pelagibacteraceae bacterium]|jgi:23S rRNA (uridine2552-2'-O)-methyltransferase|nr:RlmE family RNA methyltransferase [Pelagibacteraceae bacterium]|tara:strand:- start:1660 stop:2286 length:627 start_codon:yes stop_codon:yes gene_type:complete
MKKSKKIKKSNTWKIKQHRDQFYKKSKTLGYRSRSAFKLIELNKKYKFIKKDTKLLDVGAYPGGWSQVSSKIITSGKILSLDLKKMDQLKNVSFLQSNFLEENTKEKVFNFFSGSLNVVLSDMAADTTGNKSLDCIRTNQLCANVINFSSKILLPNGVLISKLFMGDDFLEVKDLAKTKFKKVQFFKPEASRNESKETYLYCAILKTL